MAAKSKPKRSPKTADVTTQRRAGKQAAFLEALAGGLTVTDSSAVAGINPKTQRRWREASKKFASEYEIALGRGTAVLAGEALRRATVGVARPQFYQGRPVIDPATGEQIVFYDYSDTLLIFLLKSRKPATYDDRVRAEKIFRRWRKRDGAVDDSTTPAADVIDLLDRLAAQKWATGQETQRPDGQSK